MDSFFLKISYSEPSLTSCFRICSLQHCQNKECAQRIKIVMLLNGIGAQTTTGLNEKRIWFGGAHGQVDFPEGAQTFWEKFSNMLEANATKVFQEGQIFRAHWFTAKGAATVDCVANRPSNGPMSILEYLEQVSASHTVFDVQAIWIPPNIFWIPQFHGICKEIKIVLSEARVCCLLQCSKKCMLKLW